MNKNKQGPSSQSAANTDATIDLAAQFIERAALVVEHAYNIDDLNDFGQQTVRQGPLWAEEWLDGTDRSAEARDQVTVYANNLAGYADMIIHQTNGRSALDEFRQQSVIGHQIRNCVPPEARNRDVAGTYQSSAPNLQKLCIDAMSSQIH
jgi:hypothetical protein